MQAFAVFPRDHKSALIELDEPERLGRGEAKLRVLSVGVCGTDRAICAFEHGETPRGSNHLILGHEALAQVVDVAPGVTDVAVGDLVVPIVRRPCPEPTCRPCRTGRADFCATGRYTERGIRGLDGYLRGYAVDDARYLVRVPDELGGLGVLVEPLSIAAKALAEARAISTRLPHELRDDARALGAAHSRRAIVLGAGPIGLLAMLALRVSDHDVLVWSNEPRTSPNAELARAVGASYVSAQDATVEEIGRGGEPIDLVYEATGSAEVAFGLLQAIGPNATIVWTGIPGRDAKADVNGARVMRELVLGNHVVLGTVSAGRGAYERAIRDLAEFESRWPGVTRGLITSRHGLEAAAQRICAPETGIKSVVDLHPVGA